MTASLLIGSNNLRSKVQRAWLASVFHLAFLVSFGLADDWIGRKVRRTIFRLLGADLHATASLHGGTYISDPRNLTMGAGSFINRNCYLELAGPLVLAKGVNVGHGASFVTTSQAEIPRDRNGDAAAQITLLDDCWIGANATILPGVTIGRRSIVAAGALVTTDVGDDQVVGGVPARYLREAAPTKVG